MNKSIFMLQKVEQDKVYPAFTLDAETTFKLLLNCEVGTCFQVTMAIKDEKPKDQPKEG
jgi:hypothetical protein